MNPYKHPNSSPGSSPGGSGSPHVNTTFFPSHPSGYVPPVVDSSNPFGGSSSTYSAPTSYHSADPFSLSGSPQRHAPTASPTASGGLGWGDDASHSQPDSNPFAVHDAVVPAVPAVPVHTQTSASLAFNESNLPSYDVRGRMDTSRAGVPAVGSFPGSPVTPNPVPSPGGGESSPGEGKLWFFNIKRYRKYFNVDTEDVLNRMKDSVLGSYRADFFEKTGQNADLYGPFWIATTLVFVTAMTGNYASYIDATQKASAAAAAPAPAGSEDALGWYGDVGKVAVSAGVFYGYVGGIGFALWAVLKWFFKSSETLAQVWCMYGYALTIFIPASFLCVLPFELLRWAIVSIATVTSGLFLLTNCKTPIYESAGARATPLFLVVAACHVALGLVLKLVFFQYW